MPFHDEEEQDCSSDDSSSSSDEEEQDSGDDWSTSSSDEEEQDSSDDGSSSSSDEEEQVSSDDDSSSDEEVAEGGTGQTEDRSDSPTWTTVLAAIESLGKKIDKNQKKMEKKMETNQKKMEKKMETMDEKIDKLGEKVDLGFTATLATNPEAVLYNSRTPLIGATAEELKGAVLALRGAGSSTWSFVRKKNEEGGTLAYVCLGISCAHCGLEFSMVGGTQFVVIPEELKDLVDGVYLYKEYQFGSGYGYYKSRRNEDIMFLKLVQFPPGIEEEKVLSLETDVVTTGNEDLFHSTNVTGTSPKSPVLGGSAVKATNGTWIFMLKSTPEPGHSGTVMLGFPRNSDNGAKYVLATHDSEKKRYKPSIIGLYAGIRKHEGPQPPGTICSIPPFEEFSFKKCVEAPGDKVQLFSPKQEEFEVTAVGGQMYELKNKATNTAIRGIFVEAQSADESQRTVSDAMNTSPGCTCAIM